MLGALLVGIALFTAGIGGFLPGIAQPPPGDAPALALPGSYGDLLGLFPVNVAHNLTHLLLGASGLLAFRTAAATRTYCRALAVVLGAFTIAGLVPAVSTTFGLLPLFGHDVRLHGVEAAVAAYLGWLAPVETSAASATPQQ